MSLNKKQRVTLAIGFILVALIGIFPPWAALLHEGSISYGWGNPIWKPLVAAFQTIDLWRLLVSWVVVGSLTAAFIVLFSNKRS